MLKGAIVSVLGPDAALTASVKFEHPTKAQLTIVWPSAELISPSTLLAIEAEANAIIARALPIQQLTLGRAEAEQRFRQQPVNSTFIYDKYPVPASVDPLVITLIDGVNVNCCRGPHCAHTGELLSLRILKAKKARQREKDGSLTPLYELLFVVHDTALQSFSKAKDEAARAVKGTASAAAAASSATAAASTASSSSAAASADTADTAAPVTSTSAAPSLNPSPAAAASTASMPAFQHWKPGSRSHVQLQTSALFKLLAARGVQAGSVAGLEAEVERELTMFSNVCYSMGFQAATAVNTVSRADML